MTLLAELRTNSRHLALASTLTVCLHTENGPNSHPMRIVAAATDLRATNKVNVADDVWQVAVGRALKVAEASSDWDAFWSVYSISSGSGSNGGNGEKGGARRFPK